MSAELDISEKLYAASDYSLFGPESLDDVRERLRRIEETGCECLESAHLNALHDLAHDDVPALLKLVEQLATALQKRQR